MRDKDVEKVMYGSKQLNYIRKVIQGKGDFPDDESRFHNVSLAIAELLTDMKELTIQKAREDMLKEIEEVGWFDNWGFTIKMKDWVKLRSGKEGG